MASGIWYTYDTSLPSVMSETPGVKGMTVVAVSELKAEGFLVQDRPPQSATDNRELVGGTMTRRPGSGGGIVQHIIVRPASESERPLLEGLFQFYAYDFSEMEPAASAAFEVNAEGRFAPYPHLGEYWSANGRWPLLIQVNERAIGFALINTLSHRGGDIERNMAEFFVVRKHRRRGVAIAAVRQILRLYPGRWEVAVAERNHAAKVFWARAIAAATNVRDLDKVEGDGEHWRGPIWCFRALSSDEH